MHLAAIAVLIVGCGGDTDTAAPTTTVASTTTVSYPEGIASACSAYRAASEAWMGTGADDAFAAALEEAAGAAAGTDVEGPLLEMAAGLRRGDASIPDGVTPICRGEAPTTLPPEEADRREQYLAAVRAAAPGITDGDNDLLESISLGCDLLDLGATNSNLPTNRDQLLAMAWAPLDDMEDAEHVLRVGVPLYCPQHSALVDHLL